LCDHWCGAAELDLEPLLSQNYRIMAPQSEETTGGRISNSPPRIRVTEIGEYIHHRSCERRFKLEINNRELAKKLPFAERLFNALDPVLQEMGRQREGEWEQSLKAEGFHDLTKYGERAPDAKPTAWADFVSLLAGTAPGTTVYGREVAVETDIGAFRVEGRIDFVLVLWQDGRPRLRLVECKASRRDRTYHRVQVALYRMLLRRIIGRGPVVIGGMPLAPESIECIVARIDETTNESQDILQLEPLDLEMEEADIERLLAAGGDLDRIVRADLNALPYQLDMKCDGCVFNVHCLPESARQRALELLGVEPSTVRVLRASGIGTIDQLAALDLAGTQAAEIRRAPGFTEHLAVLQRRAKARRRTLPGGDAHPDEYEVEAIGRQGQSQLPEYMIDGRPLVRIYLNVHYDYAENRIGALAAHLTTSSHP
jgi:hypothetical protein